ncbi:transcriptional regulator [Paenibacillus macerans]|uniref:Helix-turn-helix domain-containing protein n=1 Tax=Paenibacillus macerans TaxID=44252 RepID=A0A6N8F3Q1_PAEMA|nr:helix-turn-helix transcriptional regulator [Paenibacillus macerans]MBS5910796.1 helix-turn-helix transcriptional regulator [Paenibacillus macerans]MCY7559293.1 helix-turn-helix transcriptional regulator [Paenibacillus macerans]MDU5946221.1 helix-turn-helix transcriptional regulator [Paenibacillus macerans]MDU7476152.1 helix-turn-helix transcriptional regulator [Paenibacillus macerans]MEC0138848.1 helix-turn-helix transcriptional regulator [Paenibacillus macerans]
MENLHLAQRIRAFRKLKGLTQQQLAEKTGVSLAVLGAVERGNRRPDEQILQKIADALNVELAELTAEG